MQYRVSGEDSYHEGWGLGSKDAYNHRVMRRTHAFLTRNTHIWKGVEEGVYYCTHTTNSAFSAAEI